MTSNGWAAPCCVVLAAAVAGLLFAPVFGLVPLLVPVGATAAVALAAVLLCSRTASLRPWRPVLVAVGGLLAIVETVLPATTVAGVPTAGTAWELVAGAGGSWRATLQSTWPARPDAELVLFVPLLVLLAVVSGVELLHRVDAPLWSLVPSTAVLVLSQLFVPLDPVPALLAGVAYAVAMGGVFAASRGPAEDGGRPAAAGLVVPMVVGLVCAVLAGLVVPPAVSDYSLQRDQQVPLEPQQVESPLGKLAAWHLDPEAPLFEVRGAASADRWPLVVLDSFNGVTWFPGDRYRRLGSELPPPEEMRRPADLRSARITLLDADQLGGPWLPGQPAPAGVRGPRVLVDQQRGTLLRSDGGGVTAYELSWWEPRVDSLRDAAVDADAPGGLAPLGEVPPGVAELSDEAMGGLRPTFQAALVLERWMRDNYRVAAGPDVPTGHSWPQLSEFLLRTKRGTSEQFAASYVALARASGIPARLVVGFRDPAEPDGVVRGGDALAWPEVAVDGVGWVPLDPTGDAREADAADSGGPASAADRERAQLPPAQDLQRAPVAPPDRPVAEQRDAAAVPWTALLAVPVALALLWIAGAPLWGLLRSGLRRRRGVEGAMDEVRDLLRACGLPVTAGMTAKDLAVAASGHVDRATEGALRELGLVVDLALWTPPWHVRDDVAALAWTAVRSVRRGVVRRGAMTWLRVTWRPLRSPR